MATSVVEKRHEPYAGENTCKATYIYISSLARPFSPPFTRPCTTQYNHGSQAAEKWLVQHHTIQLGQPTSPKMDRVIREGVRKITCTTCLIST